MGLEDKITFEYTTFKEAKEKAEEIKRITGVEPIVYGTNVIFYPFSPANKFYVVQFLEVDSDDNNNN